MWVDELIMQLLSSRGIIVIIIIQTHHEVSIAVVIVIRTHREVSKNGLVKVERLQKL